MADFMRTIQQPMAEAQAMAFRFQQKGEIG